MTRTRSVMVVLFGLTLGLGLVGCKGSKEQQACEAQGRWVDDLDQRLGREPSEPTREQLAECVEQQKRAKQDFSLSDADYEALLDCRIAAKDMDEGLACLGPALAKGLENEFADVDTKLAEVVADGQRDADAAITKLEVHVGKGVSAETIASMRAPDASVPPARVAIVADDARQLIETGRADAEHPLTIRLQPGFGADAKPPIGLEGAELTFVEASGATVGRVAPLPANQLGVKTHEITALIEWMLEQPDTRRVELIATPAEYGHSIVFEPPEILRDTERFAKAGLAERPLIWLDGKPHTLTQWWAR